MNAYIPVWSWCPSSPTYRRTLKNYLPDVGEHLEIPSSESEEKTA